MRVVLHETIAGLGNRGDLVEVADGYARNSLIPKGLAQQASTGVEAQAEAMKRAWRLRNAKDRDAAEEVAKTLVSTPIEIAARAGAEGKLFGSVTAADIAEAIQAKAGVDIDRRMVNLDESIRNVGTHVVMVKPHPEVEFPVTVSVVEQG
ncbi:MAG: 50S ribosomal protein L9 [Acidimicrobiia bacterium]|nr:50S ribosomal protein L9 [Acidimicrobiia bacterium]